MERVAIFSMLTQSDGSEVESYWKSLVISSLLGIREHCDTDNVIVEVRDTVGSAAPAIEEFLQSELQEDGGIDVIVGPALSAVAVPLSTLAGVRGVPIISYSATSRDLSPDNLFARVLPSDAETTQVLCQLFSDVDIQNVALIFVDDDYGTAYRDSLIKACDDIGIEVYATSFQQDSESSVTFAMDFVTSRKLNIVVTVSFSQSLPTIFKHAGPDHVFIGSDAVTLEGLDEFIQMDPENNAKFVENHVLRVQATGANHGSLFEDFSARWLTLANDENTLQYLNDYMDTVNVSHVDAAFFNNTVENMSLYIPFAYDASWSVCDTLRNYSDVLADIDTKTQRGAALWDAIVSNDFEGVSGYIHIDPETGTRDVASSNFVIERFRSDPVTAYATAMYSEGNWTIDNDTFLSLPPDVTVNTQNNYIHPTAKIILVVLAVLLICWTIFLIGFTWVKRRTRIMSRAQPTILMLFLVGVVLSSCSLFFIGVEDLETDLGQEFQNFSCMALYWSWSVGTVLTFGALTAKLYRIYRIFHNRALKRIRITNMHLYGAIVGIVALDVVILTIWSSVSPLQWERTIEATDIFGNAIITYGSCTSEQENVFLALLLSYTFLLFLTGAVFSFMVRNTPSEFQESTHIVISLVSQVQLYCLGFLILFIFPHDNSDARFIVMSIVIFFNNLLITLVIYVPKFLALHNNTDRANSINTYSRSTPVQQQRVGPSSHHQLLSSALSDPPRSEIPSGSSYPQLDLRRFPSSIDVQNRRDASVQVKLCNDGHFESECYIGAVHHLSCSSSLMESPDESEIAEDEKALLGEFTADHPAHALDHGTEPLSSVTMHSHDDDDNEADADPCKHGERDVEEDSHGGGSFSRSHQETRQATASTGSSATTGEVHDSPYHSDDGGEVSRNLNNVNSQQDNVDDDSVFLTIT
mmetsp:Transcript_2489/g.5714  ORF Transcript_2489/g.5714 Transcript_2489/m.5714 type:complete len:923 (+) Transcript_2489:466-3234(+)|eukprot:CAMPEP_0171497902 /NCGR_PEP_ID=MMETSP0958-20121227/7535_1 /TAXON_ID=87120 /ORGANISM="Aurantiochytrium limacinum, Strain ATCCMYA-1381" /LENGTH=922 /DNA_ID=CAMNT_0012032207 /DNA_START=420 /DNA_END=3188 /DNA_ORIENTATION=-